MAKGKRTKPAGQLTNKQAAFVQEYLKDKNARQAAIRAGFAESTASKQAYLWVGKNRHDCPVKYQHIWDAAQEALNARSEELKIDGEWVLKRLVELYSVDFSRAFDEKGKVLPPHKLPQDVKEAMASIQGSFGAMHGIRGYDKLKILELIGKHVTVNAFKENVEVSGRVDVADTLMRAGKRKRATLMGQAREDKASE